jgi:hypothetical protein
MADRTAAATAKIAALRQKLAAAEARSRSRREICALQRLPICVNACTYSRSAEGVIPLRAEPSTVH